VVASVALETALHDELVVAQVCEHAADRRAFNTRSNSFVGDHASLDEEVFFLKIVVNGIDVIGLAVGTLAEHEDVHIAVLEQVEERGVHDVFVWLQRETEVVWLVIHRQVASLLKDLVKQSVFVNVEVVSRKFASGVLRLDENSPLGFFCS